MGYKPLTKKDGTLLGELPESKEGGRLRNIVYITSTQEYVKPTWLKFARVYGQAPGGGGGGVDATSSTERACSAGASAGGYFEKFFLAADLAESVTVTIGAPGVGGAAGINDGTDGGTISFGAYCSATGGGRSAGKDGVSSSTGIQNSGAYPGGIAVGGDMNLPGLQGAPAVFITGALITTGNGASSRYSSGGTILSAANSDRQCAGYGGGGGGAYNTTSGPSRAGGHGAPGIIIIEEYE